MRFNLLMCALAIAGMTGLVWACAEPNVPAGGLPTNVMSEGLRDDD